MREPNKVLLEEVSQTTEEERKSTQEVCVKIESIPKTKILRATPSARKLVRELGINLEEITPKKTIRFLKRDVEEYHRRKQEKLGKNLELKRTPELVFEKK